MSTCRLRWSLLQGALIVKPVVKLVGSKEVGDKQASSTT